MATGLQRYEECPARAAAGTNGGEYTRKWNCCVDSPPWLPARERHLFLELFVQLLDDRPWRVGQRHCSTCCRRQIFDLASTGGKLVFAGDHGQAETAAVGVLE